VKRALVLLVGLVAVTSGIAAAARYIPTSLTLSQSLPIHHGDTVTFTYSASKPIKDSHCMQLGKCPAVQVLCTQVGDFTQPMYASIQPAWSAAFLLEALP
jgi:hypothetical protein